MRAQNHDDNVQMRDVENNVQPQPDTTKTTPFDELLRESNKKENQGSKIQEEKEIQEEKKNQEENIQDIYDKSEEKKLVENFRIYKKEAKKRRTRKRRTKNHHKITTGTANNNIIKLDQQARNAELKGSRHAIGQSCVRKFG